MANELNNEQIMQSEEDPMAGISFPMQDEESQEAVPQSQPGDGSENTAAYKADLQQILDAIQGKINEYNSKNIANGNEIDQKKEELINSVFSNMAMQGVDLGNPDSIKQYIAEMEQTDPAKFQLFTTLMSDLMDQEEPEQTGEFPETDTEETSMDLSQVPTEGQQVQ